MLQAALRLSDDKKRRIVENRRRLLLNLEQLLRKQNMVRLLPRPCQKNSLSIQAPLEIATFTVTQPHHSGIAWPWPTILHSKVQTLQQ